MPQVLIPAFVSLGASQLAATVATTGLTVAGTYFIGAALRGGPPKPDAAERELAQIEPRQSLVGIAVLRPVRCDDFLVLRTQLLPELLQPDDVFGEVSENGRRAARIGEPLDLECWSAEIK